MSGALAAMLVGGGAPGILSTVPGASNALSASWQLVNDGTYSVGDGAGGASTGNWVTPATAPVAAYYQVKTVVTAGSFTTDPSAGSYLDLSTSRIWIKSVVGTVSFDVTVREKATGIVRLTYSTSIIVT